jgi:hypothetical protein
MFVVNRSGRKAFLIKLKKMRVEKFVAVALKVETLRISRLKPPPPLHKFQIRKLQLLNMMTLV